LLSTLLYAILVVIDKVLAYKLALTPKLENVSIARHKEGKETTRFILWYQLPKHNP
jgi:hypothetical protein